MVTHFILLVWVRGWGVLSFHPFDVGQGGGGVEALNFQTEALNCPGVWGI